MGSQGDRDLWAGLVNRRVALRMDAWREAMQGGPRVEVTIAAILADEGVPAKRKIELLPLLAGMKRVTKDPGVVSSILNEMAKEEYKIEDRGVLAVALIRRTGDEYRENLLPLVRCNQYYTASSILMALCATEAFGFWRDIFDMIQNKERLKSTGFRRWMIGWCVRYLVAGLKSSGTSSGELLVALRSIRSVYDLTFISFLNEYGLGFVMDDAPLGDRQWPDSETLRKYALRGM